jgi:hypothetical protein
MGYWIVNGKQMTDAEYEEYRRQEQEAKERVRREAAALVEKLGQTYEALTSLMQPPTKRFTESCGRACNGRTRRPGAAG